MLLNRAFVVFGFVSLIGVLTVSPSLGGGAGEDVLNFAEWKAQRVWEAEQAVQAAQAAAKSQLTRRAKSRSEDVNHPSSDGGTAGPRTRIQGEGSAESLKETQRALALARDLTAADYYLLYLRGRTPDVILRMSEKLSKSELVNILSAISQVDRQTAP